MAHREDFVRFHKNKRLECNRKARVIKQHVETMDAKKEKDEARAEARRLQALRENDMDAYLALVKETKNDRLKYLINETDTYINTINRMITDQRQDGTLKARDEGEEHDEGQVNNQMIVSFCLYYIILYYIILYCLFVYFLN